MPSHIHLGQVTRDSECIFHDHFKYFYRFKKLLRSKLEIFFSQFDIDNAARWSSIRLNQEHKHESVIMWKENLQQPYYIGIESERRAMRVSASERDLGIQVMASLKPADQVFKAASKANQVLGSLKKAFVGRSAALWKRLYTTCVRPHLEYAV